MESLAKVTMTEYEYKALEVLVARGDAILKRFEKFKKEEAIITKRLWGFISYKSYNRKALFAEFDTDLTVTYPAFGGSGSDTWRLLLNYRYSSCVGLLKFKPHEECYLTSEDCAALSYAVECYGKTGENIK